MRIKSLPVFVFILAIFFCSASSLAVEQLGPWQQPKGFQATDFELGEGAGAYRIWGSRAEQKIFDSEFLPAVFERTIAFERFDDSCKLEWIFTGNRGGFTVTVDANEVSLYQRYYDSFGYEMMLKSDDVRHPQAKAPAEKISFNGRLAALTVKMDHKLGLSVALNGKVVLQQMCMLDVSRHQLRMASKKGKAIGKILKPKPQAAVINVNPEKRYQKMMGFGGIATPAAYAQLSGEGKRKWWKMVCEYNLLIQREYPNGGNLNRAMDNFDKLEDATPHYYGDNFPNGEISDFEFIKILRKLGGKVWFEFWDLPQWVEGDVKKYAKAMVEYCKQSVEKAGAPPDVVGIQNEKVQTPEMWQTMTLQLRKHLDEAGFEEVKIHMSNAGQLATGGVHGLRRAQAFTEKKQVWDAIDYSATNMYDYQYYFTKPDEYDVHLKQWKKLTSGKPFLSTEICINKDPYQTPSYRIAFMMGQLYHKNLVITDAAAIAYCWTLLNVVQPSYGWTRTLVVPDRTKGFIPVASSNQLRVFGAFSRRVKEQMVRVDAVTKADNLLVSAFSGKGGEGTVIIMNRSTIPRQVKVSWLGIKFTETEVVSFYNENKVIPYIKDKTDLIIQPGEIVTLTNVELGKISEDVIKDIF